MIDFNLIFAGAFQTNYMKKSFSLILLSLTVLSCSKGKTDSPIVGSSWAPDVKEALNCFIELYRGTDNAYAVFDFDNTSSIFDVEEQLAIYQLETMSFAVDSAGLREAISSGLNVNNAECGMWIEDISKAYGRLCRAYGPFTAAGLDGESLKKVQADPQWKEFSTKMRKMYDMVSDWASLDDSYNWILYWFSGMTDREVYDLAYKSHLKYSQLPTSVETWSSPAEIESLVGQVSCDWTCGVQVSDAVKELWKALTKNGIDVWVCSASGMQQILAAIDAFGLHSSCTGVTAMTVCKDSEGKYFPAYDYYSGRGMRTSGDGWVEDIYATKAQTAGKGKVRTILNAIAPHYGGATPIAGFMDSTGDFNFCTEFASLKLVICFNRANRKITDGGGLIAEIAMYEKETLGYSFDIANTTGDTMYLLQGRDENGTRSLRPSNKTLRYGSSEEKLFANEDNYRQLEEIKANGMTVKEAIDTYSKLFLRSYDGYHSK